MAKYIRRSIHFKINKNSVSTWVKHKKKQKKKPRKNPETNDG